MLRIWSEFLPYEEARAPEVLELLARHQVHPIFAVRPDSDLDELSGLIGDVRAHGLEVGIWPLLSKSDGYWASESNAAAWSLRTHHVLKSLSEAPVWIAVDLEPPIDEVTKMLRDVWRLPQAVARFARNNLDQERHERSVEEWNDVVRSLRSEGYRTLGITVPVAAHDLEGSDSLWQDLCETPWSRVKFDRWGIMAYNSMVAGYSRGLLNIADARAAHDRLIQRLVDRQSAAASHVSIGLTGPGVLGDEPFYESPTPLATDASAVRSRGVEDIGLFCLEGLLAQERPDDWLTRITAAPPRAPVTTVRSRLLRQLGRGARGILGAVRNA